MISDNTSSLNTASYLNSTETTLFVKGYVSDLWYGLSPRDVIELSIWDRSNNFIGWNAIKPTGSYIGITSSYINYLNFPVTYSYTELHLENNLYRDKSISPPVFYKTEKILVNPIQQVYSSFGIFSGSYVLGYNFVRNMAGDNDIPLIVKDISPSRKELKLVPAGLSTPAYDAFVQKYILLRDVSSLYLTATQECPYGQIYNEIYQSYADQINNIKFLYSLNTDGEVINFLKNLYEDKLVYGSYPPSSVYTLTRTQGIQTYFSNFLFSNLDKILSFSDIDTNFNSFVSLSVDDRFSIIGSNPLPEYVNAKKFVYDFFTKYYYQIISDAIRTSYVDRFFSPLKNALNFGDNYLLPIISHDYIIEDSNGNDASAIGGITGSPTLLVKLKSELPTDISIQTKCWVTNIAIVPYLVDVIIKDSTETRVYKIGPPNFSAILPDISLANNNSSYTADDLKCSDEDERELTVSRNITELSVDYRDFANFVIFSSAEMRLKIFKNKTINISKYSSAINDLNAKEAAFLSASGSIYPFYDQEYKSIQGQISDIINSFDGYESYLYRDPRFSYASESFASPYYITELDISASVYDKANRDSLINNTAGWILSDENNDDYIIFLSMIGHFFDNLYIYIAEIPSEKRLGHGATAEFTRRIVDYMLQTFGWDLSDSLEETTLIDNYLNSEQIGGLDELSAEERLKAFRNRILINLPQIYKTKGTEESIRLLLSCYGIPSSLLSIREYGGVNYNTDDAAYTTYERSYMYQWHSSSRYDQFQVNLPEGPSTYLFKLVIDNANLYTYNKEQILFGSVISQSASTDISSSGQWAVGFVRTRNPNAGKMFFRIGYAGSEAFKLYSPEFPLFDGNIYSAMIRKNLPDDSFEFTPNVYIVPTKYDLVVQRNEFGRQILQVSSSAICYNTSSNLIFNSSASTLMVGGWFSDINDQAFIGAFDKLQVWKDPLKDSSFIDYANSINSYNFTGSHIPHQSLMFRMHVDYPFNVSQSGKWVNGNPFYAVSSSQKFTRYLGTSDTNGGMDSFIASSTWYGTSKPVYDSVNSCSIVGNPVYPFQFRIVEYPSTWGISKYGPNKFRNEKVRAVSQSIATIFDDKTRSTFVVANNVSPDSSQLGLFVDPQDFKNKDIVRYFGDYDIMNAIGDPSNQFSSNYDVLKTFRNMYATSKTEYSGSRTLFNELITLYKLYFNKTIFNSIKNLVPARANTLVGVVIEPTILERPKYNAKPIVSEVNSGSVLYREAAIVDIMRMTQSVDYGTDVNVNMTYINFPSISYPVNYAFGGTYITDISDKYEMGHFSGPIRSPIPILPMPIPPTLTITCAANSGQVGVVYNSQFSASSGILPYTYSTGSSLPPGLSLDTSSGIVAGIPITAGVFPYLAYVKDSSVSYQQATASCGITIALPPIPPAPLTYPCGHVIQYQGGLSYPFVYTMSFAGHKVDDDIYLTYQTTTSPVRFMVYYRGMYAQEVGIHGSHVNVSSYIYDTGYVGDTTWKSRLDAALIARGERPMPIRPPGAGTFQFSFLEHQFFGGTEIFHPATDAYPAYVYVYDPIGAAQWKFTLSCPY